MGERSGSRYPFTASQWQELEHQALIFKCMATGIPIPHDLILPIKSFYLDYTSTSAATLFPHQSSIGWQMWFGKKGEDPEPGRCRRTDGKKWRCSREAYPESKYCERHMHRGKNRSRKRVEAPTATTSTTAGAAATATSPNPCLYNRLPMAAASEAHVYSLCSASRDTVTGFPPPRSSPHFNLHTASSSADRDSRYNNVWKERVDRYTFSEATIARRDEPRRLTPLGMDSLGTPRGRSCSSLQHNGGCFTATVLPTEERRNKSQHCFVLQGDDFDVGRSTKAAAEEPQKPLPPSKSKNLWMDQQEGPGREVLPRTHLSISIPMAHQDFRSRDGD